MLDEVFKELRSGIEKALEALHRDLSKVRTGRAHAGMLDSVRVDYYGVSTPLARMATVAVPEPRLITVKPWEKGQAKHTCVGGWVNGGRGRGNREEHTHRPAHPS